MYYIFVFGVVIFLITFLLKKKNDDSKLPAIHWKREVANAPKILYLRGFKVDGDDGSNGNISVLKLMSKEKDLAKTLINLDYHLVAVGRPDEELPDVGFDRRTFSHDVWQHEVIKLMNESHLIIWRPDTTHGVLWELGKLLELDYRPKLIIWAEMGYENMVNLQKTRYNVFKRKAFEKLSEEFPPFDKYKKFLVSSAKNEWNIYQFMQQIPLYKKIAEQGQSMNESPPRCP
jgi:hypothetical protein